jgi:hypothetical protein
MLSAPARGDPEVDRVHFAEMAKCSAYPEYFLSHYAKVNDAKLGTVPFDLWPHLPVLLDLWARYRLVVILKARQLGVSWLLAGYALHMALFRQGANVLMVSKGETEAGKLLVKARFMANNLPEWMLPERTKDNDSRLAFRMRASGISALPSTKDAGRSETATLVILDEFAFHEHGEENLAAIKPAIDAGGQMLIVSTAHGANNKFSEVWNAATSAGLMPAKPDGVEVGNAVGMNGFYPVFLRWNLAPGRGADWFENASLEYTPQELQQEYPSNPTEAFLKGGAAAFPQWDRERHTLAQFPIPPHWERRTGMDWGTSAPFVCLWAAYGPRLVDDAEPITDCDGRHIYVYREYSATGLLDQQMAQAVATWSKGEKIAVHGVDPNSFFTKNSQTGYNPAQVFLQMGVRVVPSSDNLDYGKRAIDYALSPCACGVPRMRILDNCRMLIATLPKRDLDKRDPRIISRDQKDDHWVDGLKYLLMAPIIKPAPAMTMKARP